jgi:UDP-2,3-diacylglucosamine pyrophosphatase LpxH
MRSRSLSRGKERELIIVSDLHIGDGGQQERFRLDETMCAFLGHLRDHVGRSPEPLRLLILGDFLDLSLIARASPAKMSQRSVRNALLNERIDEVMAAHGDLFRALRIFIEAGGSVDVVPGNSDAALQIRFVWEHFRHSLLRGCSTAGPLDSLQLHPWIYHLPGVLYAEHGNQYHEINSFPAVLEGLQKGEPHQVETAGSLLAAYGPRSDLGTGRSRKEVARWMASLATQMVLASQVRRTAAYQSLVEHYASEVSLPPALVAELERLGSRAIWRSGLRALRRSGAARPARGRVPSDSYLKDAALHVHSAARRHDSPAFFYVFGHTHTADISSMDGGSSRYVNCGTWATPITGSSKEPDTPYVHMTLGSEPSCRLLNWGKDRRNLPPGSYLTGRPISC